MPAIQLVPKHDSQASTAEARIWAAARKREIRAARLRAIAAAGGIKALFDAIREHFAERARIRAANERAIVLIAWHDALDRQDTRAQHQLKPGVVHATCATLAAEMGRSPLAWRGNR